MTKRIVRRNGLTFVLVLIVLGLLCTVGVAYAAAAAPTTPASSR